MGYIDQNLLPEEKIIFRTRKSLIIFSYPVLWTVVCIATTGFMLKNDILIHIVWTPWLIAFVFWLSVWLSYISSDFAVTDKRIMMREGVFTRHANEIRIATISQVNINQNLWGQLFNYGTVSINTFGAYDAYTQIAKPFLFQKYVNAQLDKLAR